MERGVGKNIRQYKSNVNTGINSYNSINEFKRDLQIVFKTDYGVELSGKDLDEATDNLNKLLMSSLG